MACGIGMARSTDKARLVSTDVYYDDSVIGILNKQL